MTPAAATSNSCDTLAATVMERCDAVARCTEEPGRVTRRFLSTPMRKVHDQLSGWMRQAGLEPHADAAGNLIGRKPTANADRVLLVGSHLDSVPGAGKYDGVLGVLMGVAVCEALQDRALPFRLEVVGFSEEEGVRYNMPYLGSGAVAGCFEPRWLDRVDSAGVSMREAITAFGGDASRLADAAYAPEQVIGYVEPHLEQGPVLERSGASVGVVSNIVGQSRLRLEFLGEAGHVGTTPMSGRQDALVAASAFVGAVRTAATRIEGLRATVGKLEVTPNAPNVIAERVELSLDVRHSLDGPREEAVSSIIAEAESIAKSEGCHFKILETMEQDAVAVDSGLTSALADAIAAGGREPLHICSGAGHDAVIMARRFPVAMLFVRHPGGVSHHPDERVEQSDVAAGIDALTRFVLHQAERCQQPTPTKAPQ